MKNKDFIKHDDESILSVIWSQDNFIELADHIFVVYTHNEELQFWPIPRYITALLIIGDKDNFENIIKHQDEWITHFIDIHFNNSNLMKTLFSAIADAGFLPERRKKHLLYLITLNNDYELFENIQLESRSYGGWESESILFLESLLPALTGLAYLKHKRRIEKDIEGWKRQIEHEQIRDILRGD